MKKILISACLLGENVRYDAKVKYYRNEMLERLKSDYTLISFCPEAEGGLPTPRPPSEIQDLDGSGVIEGAAKIKNSEGRDVTPNFLQGAKKALNLAKEEGIKIAILKSKSPSCSNNKIYDGTFSNNLKIGKGVTVALFEKEDIKVFNEYELKEALEYLQ